MNGVAMKLDELHAMWEKDVVIDRTELGEESLRIPTLHSKYFKLFSQERIIFKKMEADLKQLYKDKFEYYSGTLSEEALQSYGWEPNPLRILRSDVSVYLDGDSDLNALNLKIEVQKEKVDFIEAIIKSLTTRGFQIKSAIEWEKFKMGV